MADVKWIKLMVGMFDGASFKKIKKATLADGQSYRDKLTAVWFELLDLAAKKNLNGQLCNVEDLEIPFTSESQFEDIAIMIDRQPEEVSCCIGWFIKNKMIVIVDDIYSLANWEKYQEEDKLAQIREQNRIRKANQRARLTMSRDCHVTQRDCHALDIDIEEDRDKNKNIKETNTKEKSSRFSPPSLEEVTAFCKERNNNIDPEQFIAFYESKGWKIGKNPMKDWKAAIITWEKRRKEEHPEEEKCKYATSGFDTL